MGVSVEVWRARCGLFNCRICKSPAPCCTCAADISVVLCVLFAILSILLIIGNIEVNPGPTYLCRLCSQSFESVESQVAHQQLHQNESNFFFRCPHSACAVNLSFRTLKELNAHLMFYHRSPKPASAGVGRSFACNVRECGFPAQNMKALVHHIFSHLQKQEPILCVYGGCPHQKTPFTTVRRYRVHLSQYHSGWTKEGDASASALQEEGTEETGDLYQYDPGIEDMDCDDFSPAEPESYPTALYEDDDTVVKYVARFYLMLQADKNVPASTVQHIATYFTTISDIIQARMKTKITSLLQKLNVPEEEVKVLIFQMQSSDPLFTTHHTFMPGPNLTSEHFRKEFYRKYFGYLDPLEIGLSVDRKSEKKVQYVPVEESLCGMLEDLSIQKQVDESFQRTASEPGRLIDYYDGEVMKKRNEGLAGEETIDLILFQDAFSVVSPIGSAKSKYKILGTYLTLGNLKPWIRSKLNAMRLVMLFKEPLINQMQTIHEARTQISDLTVGVRQCFGALLTDLQKLVKEGIMYKGRRVRVRLTHILGDNLGSHMIGGFRQFFKSGHVCRFCTLTLEKFKRGCGKGVRVLTGKLRCRAHYNRCVLRAKLLNLSHSLGIKHNSVFNGLGDFHVCDGLPPCLAHDFFEGVGSEDLALILKDLVAKKWFTYKFLNRRIQQFKFKHSDSTNKPAPCNEKKKKKTKLKLGGHAVQNWTLIRFLPFLIGDKVKDVQDPSWQFYLRLKELCEIICSLSFTADQLNNLKHVIIPSYLEARVDLFGASSLIPKHHFMCHYPDLIIKYGPLFGLWTLRFESFHSYFKTVARHNNNFINVERSLALKYQLRMCYLSSGELFPEETVISGTSIPVSSEQLSHQEVCALSGLLSPGAVSVSSISCDGLAYTRHDRVLLKRCEDSFITVGNVQKIICDGDLKLLLLKQEKATYNADFGLYHIVEPIEQELLCVSISSLENPVVQPTYDFKNMQSFTLKHFIL